MTFQIEMSRLILCEGKDAEMFFRNTLSRMGRSDVQVLDFGGIQSLTKFLTSISKMDGFSDVANLAIARDAEGSAGSAMQSVCSSLKTVFGMDRPVRPFEWFSDQPRMTILLFPGPECDGALEDLCLAMLDDQSVMPTIDGYIADFQERHCPLAWPHKSKLHTVFALSKECVGMKIGEAAKTRLFNLEAAGFKSFRQILETM